MISTEDKDAQIKQIKSAIHKVVEIGPTFLSDKITADEMAHTMITAVKNYAEEAEKADQLKPKSDEAEELTEVLQEIMGCASGYLAQRCDAACVARTITYLVNEFPK